MAVAMHVCEQMLVMVRVPLAQQLADAQASACRLGAAVVSQLTRKEACMSAFFLCGRKPIPRF